MNIDLASRPDSNAQEAATSEPRETSASWIQPSITTMYTFGGSAFLAGKLISDVYLVPEALDDTDDDEMDGLAAAYDDAKSHSSDSMSLNDAIVELEQKRGKA